MCLICVEFKKETLTVTEGWRNLREMSEGMTDEHYDEVVAMLTEAYEVELDDFFSDDGEDLGELLNKMDLMVAGSPSLDRLLARQWKSFNPRILGYTRGLQRHKYLHRPCRQGANPIQI